MSKAQVSGHLHSQVDYDPNCAEGEPESEEEDYQSQAVDPLQQCIPDKEKTIKSRTAQVVQAQSPPPHKPKKAQSI